MKIFICIISIIWILINDRLKYSILRGFSYEIEKNLRVFFVLLFRCAWRTVNNGHKKRVIYMTPDFQLSIAKTFVLRLSSQFV